jgi:hypothetical protein
MIKDPFVLDFDGTCVTHSYPHIGDDIGAVPVLKELTDNGWGIVLFTMRDGKELDEAVQWFSDNDVPLYGIQKAPAQGAWTTSPKAYGHFMIDDTAVGTPLIIPEEAGAKPYVDWKKMRRLLIEMKYLPDLESDKIKMVVGPTQEEVQIDLNDFNPQNVLMSRYADKKINEKYYGRIYVKKIEDSSNEKSESTIKLIGEIDFKDVKVPVYHDPYSDMDYTSVCWSIRNPKSEYVGLMFMDYTCKISYPEDAVIPEQTERDREKMPKFIVTGVYSIVDEWVAKVGARMNEEYDVRNRKSGISL